MPDFNPEAGPDAGLDTIQANDPKRERLQSDYTDDEILIEARRRGLLMRIEASTLVPGSVARNGYPLEDQIHETMQRAAHEATVAFLRAGRQPRGMRVEWIADQMLGPHENHRKITFPLNFVVEKK